MHERIMNNRMATQLRGPTSARRTAVLLVFISALPGCGLIVREATIAYIAVNAQLSRGDVEIENQQVLH